MLTKLMHKRRDKWFKSYEELGKALGNCLKLDIRFRELIVLVNVQLHLKVKL